ncbi:MAG: PIN domain-containing protein, partial [Methanothrix sp.]|nr:PIN domain-containing protein [Methanothrix sp.]
NEVFHKLMISEIVDKFGVQAKAANSLFKQRPEIISELCDVWDEMDIINNINIMIIDGQIFPEFVNLSMKYRLLAMDSVHLAIMRRNGLTNLATNDADFKRVADLKIWKP